MNFGIAAIMRGYEGNGCAFYIFTLRGIEYDGRWIGYGFAGSNTQKEWIEYAVWLELDPIWLDAGSYLLIFFLFINFFYFHLLSLKKLRNSFTTLI